MSFLTYLDNYQKKFEKQVVVEQPIKIIEKQIVKENVVVQKVIPKKIIKIVKKVVQSKPVCEHINHAAQLLDGLDDGGYNPMVPSSSRFYDNTGLSSRQNLNIKENKNITSRANDLCNDLSEDNSSGGRPQPLRDIPQMDVEMLKFVPKEMLDENQKQQVNINETKKEIEFSPKAKQMMEAMREQTKQMQNMFNNVDMSEIPLEFR